IQVLPVLLSKIRSWVFLGKSRAYSLSDGPTQGGSQTLRPPILNPRKLVIPECSLQKPDRDEDCHFKLHNVYFSSLKINYYYYRWLTTKVVSLVRQFLLYALNIWDLITTNLRFESFYDLALTHNLTQC